MNRNLEIATIEFQQARIVLALMQIDNLTELLKDNEYKTYLYGHLITMRVELERQLSNLTKKVDCAKIKE